MKRGLVIGLLFVFIFFALSVLVLAYDGFYDPYYGYGYEGLTISELAQNEWVNVALLFILIFTVCHWVLQRVFHTSLGAAFVAAAVLGIMGAFGTISFIGPIIPKVGWWVAALFIILILVILWSMLRKRGTAFFIIAFVFSLLWLLWLRALVCPFIFPYIACIVLDAVTIAAIIIAVISALIWVFRRLQLHKPAYRPEEWKEEKEERQRRREEERQRRKEEERQRRREEERQRRREEEERRREEKWKEKERRRKALKMREHLEKSYMQKKKERERLQRTYNSLLKKRRKAEKITTFAREYELKEIDKYLKRVRQKLKTLDSEMNELVSRMSKYPRR